MFKSCSSRDSCPGKTRISAHGQNTEECNVFHVRKALYQNLFCKNLLYFAACKIDAVSLYQKTLPVPIALISVHSNLKP